MPVRDVDIGVAGKEGIEVLYPPFSLRLLHSIGGPRLHRGTVVHGSPLNLGNEIRNGPATFEEVEDIFCRTFSGWELDLQQPDGLRVKCLQATGELLRLLQPSTAVLVDEEEPEFTISEKEIYRRAEAERNRSLALDRLRDSPHDEKMGNIREYSNRGLDYLG